ncbi:cell wall hydrolase [Acetatifactor muris]|uniref:Spore cortex-lytic enzyme n=1 Tax=Acetatifactor muris TaxID=879566 RepID=A0A2K4ZG19_9FIRM|nr:cell wall hydrolase [Acetatifactor muris]MCR2047592.1 cell wall hydrolase [Acetatifactor muris]SOY29405.1 Spore cortex-lytic enzyme precursor [Acetatifactor muris]
MKIWKKMAVLAAVALLIGAVDSVAGPGWVSAITATRDKINKTQREKDDLEDELNKTQDNLDQLEGKRDTLEKELNYLNSQLSSVVENLENLESQIREKEQEIADTQAALDEAKATEAWQYESMVILVRCMYEQPEENYLTVLLSAGSFSEVLNMADRIEKMVAYDQKMLEAYKENRILIEESEARLQEEKIQLEALQAQAQEERDKVSGMINQTSNSIAKYGNQISDAEKKALAYEAQIKEKEEDLEYLKQVLAEEIAKSQAAANGVWRDISEVSFAEGDKKLLANLIYCEAGAEPYEGKVAVGSVVINRVLSSQYPDTVLGVIYQNRQFSPVASGRLDLALAADIANNDCYRAAEEAMSGISNVGNCVYFRTPIEGLSGISIGGHIFY